MLDRLNSLLNGGAHAYITTSGANEVNKIPATIEAPTSSYNASSSINRVLKERWQLEQSRNKSQDSFNVNQS